MGIKKTTFSGSWYPATEKECITIFEDYKSKIKLTDEDYKGVGGIVPHAGWYFSGKTAFTVFYNLAQKSKPDVVFLFGMHLSELSPNYIFNDDEVETPLGNLKVNREIVEKLLSKFSFVEENSYSFTPDNTVELQLPFVKYFFPDVSIVTVGVAPVKTAVSIGSYSAEIAKTMGINAIFIGSTDLTHYGPNYGFLPQGPGEKGLKWVKEVNDRRIIELFTKMDPQGVIDEALNSRNSCCPGAAAAAISASKNAGATKGVLLDYTTSYDIHPDLSFVGYAAIVF